MKNFNDDLFLKVINGIPVDDVQVGENLKYVYDNFYELYEDLNYKKFKRVDPPLSNSIYSYAIHKGKKQNDNDEWEDDWEIYTMSDDEKKKMQDTHKKAWANATDSYSEPFIRKNANKKTWIFNEETCEYNPPVPAPSDMSDHGKVYEWDDDTLSWIYIGG